MTRTLRFLTLVNLPFRTTRYVMLIEFPFLISALRNSGNGYHQSSNQVTHNRVRKSDISL